LDVPEHHSIRRRLNDGTALRVPTAYGAGVPEAINPDEPPPAGHGEAGTLDVIPCMLSILILTSSSLSFGQKMPGAAMSLKEAARVRTSLQPALRATSNLICASFTSAFCSF